jgi:hypothetical protein
LHRLATSSTRRDLRIRVLRVRFLAGHLELPANEPVRSAGARPQVPVGATRRLPKWGGVRCVLLNSPAARVSRDHRRRACSLCSRGAPAPRVKLGSPCRCHPHALSVLRYPSDLPTRHRGRAHFGSRRRAHAARPSKQGRYGPASQPPPGDRALAAPRVLAASGRTRKWRERTTSVTVPGTRVAR